MFIPFLRSSHFALIFLLSVLQVTGCASVASDRGVIVSEENADSAATQRQCTVTEMPTAKETDTSGAYLGRPASVCWNVPGDV